MSPPGAIPRHTPKSGVSFAEAVEVAQTAERGKFDLLFLADSAAVNLSGNADARGRMGKVVKFEPMTLLSALAAVTKHLGLVATSTTTYNEPYTLARQFASLDQISGGRAGWNLVTSNNEADALNFSRDEHLRACRPLRARDRVRRGRATACGTAGTTTPSSATRSRASSSTRRRSMCSTTRASTSRCAGRSTSPARRRAGRCWCRPARRSTGRDARRADRRAGVHRADHFEQAQGVLRRRQGAPAAVRPHAGRGEGHAGLQSGGRPHRGGGAGEVRLPAVADPAQVGICDPRAHDRRARPRQAAARRAGAGDGRHQRPAQPPAPAARGGAARQAHLVGALPAQCRPARPRAGRSARPSRSPT